MSRKTKRTSVGGRSRMSYDSRHRLNAICPYYTMFPLEFPMNVLRSKSRSTVVLDPFCGRGTTNYASRVLGFRSYGFDTSPVAVAIAKAKLAAPSVRAVLDLARKYMDEPDDYYAPKGKFWSWAYHPRTLDQLCRIRSRLLSARSGDSVHLLRAIMLGALHGPLPRDLSNASYFSNQMPRTFAAKPIYSTNYWKARAMRPPNIDVLDIVKKRTEAALKYVYETTTTPTAIQCGNAAKAVTFDSIGDPIDLVITSPPYYGLRTYIEDQWLRNWFLGGSDTVSYGGHPQLNHGSEEKFAKDLALVWNNVASVSGAKLRMLIRFGSIGSRSNAPGAILRRSLALSDWNWEIKRSIDCGTASDGKRQANHMVKGTTPIQERDYSISLMA